jgi:hypothetical protein
VIVDTALGDGSTQTIERIDRLDVTSWLERDGGLVTGGVYWDVKIYDGTTLIQTITNNSEAWRADLESNPYSDPQAPDSTGCYRYTWEDTTLAGGKVYTVVTRIQIGTGGTFTTPSSLTISEEESFQDLQDFISTQLDKPLSEVEQGVQDALDDQFDLINQTMIDFTCDTQQAISDMEDGVDDIKQAASDLQDTVDAATGTLNSLVSDMDAAVDDVLASAVEVEAAGLKYAGEAMAPSTVILGDDVLLQYRGESGLQPLVDVINADGELIVDDGVMEEDDENEGLYTYEMDRIRASDFPPGKPFLVMVTAEVEVAEGKYVTNLETTSVQVESTSLTTIEGLVAAGAGVKSIAQDALDAIQGVEGALATGGNIDIALQHLREQVDDLPRRVAEEGITVQMRSAVNELADKVNSLVGEEGYAFGELLEEGLSQSPTVSEVRSKVDETMGIVDLLQLLFERKLGGRDDPVVHVIYE